jgi:transposase-like protein
MTRKHERNGLSCPRQQRKVRRRCWEAVMDVLVEHGFGGLARAVEILVNEAMQLERAAALEAAPYERSPRRRGYANGFKPKRLKTRVGELELAVPKTRGVPFYPSALERGSRSERALKAAVAEMYVQGVTTRKVAAVMEELCGFDVTSSQVSRAVALLDEERTCCWTPATKRSASAAAWCRVRYWWPWGSRPTAAARSWD